MNPTKRIITLALLLVLSFTFTACAADGADVLGVTNPTTPLDTASGGHAAQSDDAIAAGEVYRNEYFKFTCNLSDDWYVLNQDEISQMLGVTYDALGDGTAGDIIQDSFRNGGTQMDFYAISRAGGQSINIILSKAKVLELLLSDQMLMKASVPLLTSGLTDMGATNIETDTKKITVLGKEHVALLVEADYEGSSMQETIFSIRQGGYLSTITITDMTGSPDQDALDYFQVID